MIEKKIREALIKVFKKEKISKNITKLKFGSFKSIFFISIGFLPNTFI